MGAKLERIDATIKEYNDSLALAQGQLAEAAKALATEPTNREHLATMRKLKGYIAEVLGELSDLNLAREATVEFENSEEGQAAKQERGVAGAKAEQFMKRHLPQAGQKVDMAFRALINALNDWRITRQMTQDAWAGHFGKLPLDADLAENIGFLTRMHLGDGSPEFVSTFGNMVMDMMIASGLNLNGMVSVPNCSDYTGYSVKLEEYPDNRMWFETSGDRVGRRAFHRMAEHEARYGD